MLPASSTSSWHSNEQLDPVNSPIGASSPPIVVNGVVIVGSAFAAGAAPPTKEMPAGGVMGFDARTGKRLWTFHTIAPARRSWRRNLD